MSGRTDGIRLLPLQGVEGRKNETISFVRPKGSRSERRGHPNLLIGRYNSPPVECCRIRHLKAKNAFCIFLRFSTPAGEGNRKRKTSDTNVLNSTRYSLLPTPYSLLTTHYTLPRRPPLRSATRSSLSGIESVAPIFGKPRRAWGSPVAPICSIWKSGSSAVSTT